MSQAIENWAQRVCAGEVRALSRAITAIENHQAEAEELLRLLFPRTGKAYLTGVTGAPGTGKSTLVDRLAAHYRAKQEQVGVIAVDPTSPYSGGAILGDRIRMQGHAGDAGMFIRSMATRGFLGGLARATAEVALLLDAAGKQQVLIETVGVGQDEIDIVRLADCVVVMLVPGMGDDIQNMKAGLMEIGDIFVLNKSDREGADRLEQQLNAMLSLVTPREGWHPPVVRTVASENKGIDGLAETIGLISSQNPPRSLMDALITNSALHGYSVQSIAVSIGRKPLKRDGRITQRRRLILHRASSTPFSIPGTLPAIKAETGAPMLVCSFSRQMAKK